jgi:hypothetical protein
MSNLQDLALELTKRGVYCVLVGSMRWVQSRPVL